MTPRPPRLAAACAFFVLSALGVSHQPSMAAVDAPHFEIDPLWPRPLPNNWRIGSVAGVWVDETDAIWILHRPESLNRKELYAATSPPGASCCSAAPPVLKFDQAGNLLESWGGPGEGYDWPEQGHGLMVDHRGHVWIAGSGRQDSQVLKFSGRGKFLLQIGKPGLPADSQSTRHVKSAAKVFVQAATNEAYVADGYGNRRVVVFDADSGAYRRHWGAYGRVPDDGPSGPYDPDGAPASQFRSAVHCVGLSVDNLVYVCDRSNDRVQVFRPDGTFLKEKFIERRTTAEGSVWDVAFSHDRAQKYLYVADGSNEKIHVLLRETLEELTSFGAGGRQPGQFYAVHNLATDSRGNLYTAETYEGKRVQRFRFKGIAPVASRYQGVAWPAPTPSIP